MDRRTDRNSHHVPLIWTSGNNIRANKHSFIRPFLFRLGYFNIYIISKYFFSLCFVISNYSFALMNNKQVENVHCNCVLKAQPSASEEWQVDIYLFSIMRSFHLWYIHLKRKKGQFFLRDVDFVRNELMNWGLYTKMVWHVHSCISTFFGCCFRKWNAYFVWTQHEC